MQKQYFNTSGHVSSIYFQEYIKNTPDVKLMLKERHHEPTYGELNGLEVHPDALPSLKFAFIQVKNLHTLLKWRGNYTFKQHTDSDGTQIRTLEKSS